MIKIAVYTLGCRANQYDSEVLKEKLSGRYKLVSFDNRADIYIINTCTVTKSADRKSRKYIRRAARAGGLVVVTGCYPTFDASPILEIKGVDAVFSNFQKNKVDSIVERVLTGERGEIDVSGGWDLQKESISRDSKHTRAFLKVQDGCNNRCAFCKVRFVRGPSRSKSIETVTEEAKRLGGNGYKELVLTGIDLADYRTEDGGLVELLLQLEKLRNLKRIRLSSINQNGVTRRLSSAVKEMEKICTHFHIPLQTGSDRLLERMNRGHNSQNYVSSVNMLKEAVEGSTFGTDLLVGFPGETEKDVERTLEVIREVGFLNVHVFRFSPREGTPAADFPDQIPSQEKNRRSRRLREFSKQIASEEQKGHLNNKYYIILEEKSSETGGWRGFSENYLDLHLGPETRERFSEGDLIEVELTELREDYYLAEPLKN
ncbi:MAG: tRNA (N(6)-L-threonylcarbamoyladenosine(37)-C(2))-methylthiotransferase MtaB [Candidatus Acetothermia bacterium]